MRYFASAIMALALSTVLPAVTVAAEVAPKVPAGIATLARGDGWWFVDAKGMVLYTFERDKRTPGKSECDGACAKQWPPVAAPADAEPIGDWTTIKRSDGSLQWAYKGQPLYALSFEGGPGTSFGDGQAEAWYVAYQPIWTPTEATITNTLLGRVLADARGMTVYTYDADKAGKSACTGSCLSDWTPIEAPLAASDHEPWSTVTRDDGSRQWAYQGKPLYRYIRDASTGETGGNGVGKKWHATVLQPAATYPAWVTVQGSDAGPLLADSEGRTIYTFNIYRRLGLIATSRLCDGEPCVTPEWKPILADAQAKAQGNWSVLVSKNGTRQWAYKGLKLYTNELDERSGDFWGIRFGGDRSWETIMHSGMPMQGTTVGGGVGGQGGGR